MLKEDLAGGSGQFGPRCLVGHSGVGVQPQLGGSTSLGGEWVSKRLALRFGIITLAGRVVRHARTLIIRLGRGHPSYHLLLKARRRILDWLTDRPDRPDSIWLEDTRA